MKKVLIAFSITFLAQTTIAYAATDWTPYLKPMMSGCSFPTLKDKLPSRYKASIASKKVKGNPEIEGEDIYTTYTLRNATAFGQPLSKVEYLTGWEWGHLKLYFKDTKFTALRPQFKLPKLDADPDLISTVIKNNAQGYQVDDGIGMLELEFNKTQKSISCFWGH